MSSKLQLDGRYHKLVVAPSGERLRGKSRQVKLCDPCLSALKVININPRYLYLYLY